MTPSCTTTVSAAQVNGPASTIGHMGLFSKKTPESAAVKEEAAFHKTQEIARKGATKRGVDLSDALIFSHDLQGSLKDMSEATFVLRPGRVEILNHGKTGTMLKAGAGVESIPVDRIASVQCRNEGIGAVLDIHGSGNSLTYRTDVITGPRLRAAVVEAMGAAERDTPLPEAQGPTDDAMAQLGKLKDLRSAGVLTDDEFATKKAELLDRI